MSQLVLMRVKYLGATAEVETWIPELVREEDAPQRAAELAVMPGAVHVRAVPIEDPSVPGTVLTEAWRRSRRDPPPPLSARAQLDLLIDKDTPGGHS